MGYMKAKKSLCKVMGISNKRQNGQMRYETEHRDGFDDKNQKG